MSVEFWLSAALTIGFGLLAFFRIDHLVLRRAMSTDKPTTREKVMFASLLVSLALCSLGFLQLKMSPAPPPPYVQQWGTELDNNRRPYGVLIVRGNYLQDKSANYKLAAVVLVSSDMSENIDVSGLQKSARFDIVDDLETIPIPYSDAFIRLSRRRTKLYALLLVPNATSLDQFATLRQAEKFGVIILGWFTTGP
jgi:hypothetical protein